MRRCRYETLKIGEPKRYYFYVVLPTVYYELSAYSDELFNFKVKQKVTDMKNIFFFILFALSSAVYGQEKLAFEKVIETDSLGKDGVFLIVNDWFVSAYKSAKNVIQISDKEGGLIVGNATMSYSMAGASYMCYTGNVNYNIRVECKENRFRATLSDFRHVSSSGNSSCSLGLITNSEVFATKGASKKYHNKVWLDIKSKCEEYSNKIFASMKAKVEGQATNDDW